MPQVALTERDQPAKSAIEEAVKLISEHISNGIIIVTDVEDNGNPFKWIRTWGHNGAVEWAMQRELVERQAFYQMELDQATGYCTCADDED